ncbi:hypothetical protein MRB53_015962 [Persea americana]|uniref:Uncharacterized protein n=1 Tax=Persea americana TaxID=3435 RepID=A0ACC2M1D0_PERAE|nr:hypothetical protein MRB53_015962 [Persea americana]
MAPVFSRNAWRCVWHMIQPAHEKIGVVDSQWVVHQAIPSLRNQGKAEKGKTRWQGVNKRCFNEWLEFETRLVNSDKEYFSEEHEGKDFQDMRLHGGLRLYRSTRTGQDGVAERQSLQQAFEEGGVPETQNPCGGSSRWRDGQLCYRFDNVGVTSE